MTINELIQSLLDIKEYDRNRPIFICGIIEDECGTALPILDVNWMDTSDGIL
jgi:hypothetical protein